MDKNKLENYLRLIGAEQKDRLHIRGEEPGQRALYYTHKGRIYSTGTRLRLSMSYAPTRPEQDETVFASDGRRYPYPGGLDLPFNYAACAAELDAAPLLGYEDEELCKSLRRAEPDIEAMEGNGLCALVSVEGQGMNIAPETLRVINTLVRENGGKTGTTTVTRYLGTPLVSMTIGPVTLQFRPGFLHDSESRAKEMGGLV